MNQKMSSGNAVRARSGRLVRSKIFLAVAALFLGSAPVGANPVGGQVANGQATIVRQGNTLSVTNSPNTIINWQSFSIDAGEITRFIQQNPGSSVLNRIMGQNPSQI